jgi:hypothetical protein
MDENKLPKSVAKGALLMAGIGVVWDHRGGLPQRCPPDPVSVIGYIVAASTTTTPNPNVIAIK